MFEQLSNGRNITLIEYFLRHIGSLNLYTFRKLCLFNKESAINLRHNQFLQYFSNRPTLFRRIIHCNKLTFALNDELQYKLNFVTHLK